jgi:hypothetical protein
MRRRRKSPIDNTEKAERNPPIEREVYLSSSITAVVMWHYGEKEYLPITLP